MAATPSRRTSGSKASKDWVVLFGEEQCQSEAPDHNNIGGNAMNQVYTELQGLSSSQRRMERGMMSMMEVLTSVKSEMQDLRRDAVMFSPLSASASGQLEELDQMMRCSPARSMRMPRKSGNFDGLMEPRSPSMASPAMIHVASASGRVRTDETISLAQDGRERTPSSVVPALERSSFVRKKSSDEGLGFEESMLGPKDVHSSRSNLRSLELRAQFQNVLHASDYHQRARMVLEEFAQESVARDSVASFLNMEHRGENFGRGTESMAHYVLMPSSSARMILDLFSLAVLLYDLITTPFMLAWDKAVKGALNSVSWVVAVFWTFDIFISFRTGFFRNGEEVTDPAEISKRYLRTFFPIDVVLLTTDWMNMIFLYLEDVADESVTRFANSARLLRMMKVMRMLRLTELFLRLQDRLKFSAHWKVVLEIITPFFLIMWLNHLNSCAWFAIAVYLHSDTGNTWLDIHDPLANQNYRDMPEMYQYTTAFHWSMTQMTPGSMQVVPKNSFERIFNILCLLFGLVFFSTIISSLSAKLMQWRMLTQETTMKLTILRKWLKQARVPTNLGIKVEKQICEKMETKKPLTPDKVPVLRELSLSLKSNLMMELTCQPIVSNSVFRLCALIDQTVLNTIAMEVVEFHSLAGGETLFLPGSDAPQVYHTVRGALQYLPDSMASRRASNRYGTFFGEGMGKMEEVSEGKWICEIALWCKWAHVGTLEAKEVCELIALPVEKLLRELLKVDVLSWFIHDYAVGFLNCVSYAAQQKNMPNDLKVPNTELEEIVLYLRKESRTLIGLLAIEELRHRTKSGGLANTWQRKGYYKLGELKGEVLGEQTILLSKAVSEGREVERLTVVILCRLKNADGRILTQLGKVVRELPKDDGPDVEDGGDDSSATGKSSFHIDCQTRLPGMKQVLGEAPERTLETLMNGRLVYFAGRLGDIAASDWDRQVDITRSEKYGVRTKYIRFIFSGNIDKGVKVPGPLKIASTPPTAAPSLRTSSFRERQPIERVVTKQLSLHTTGSSGGPRISPPPHNPLTVPSTGVIHHGTSTTTSSPIGSGFAISPASPTSSTRLHRARHERRRPYFVSAPEIMGVLTDNITYIFGWLAEEDLAYYSSANDFEMKNEYLKEYLETAVTAEDLARIQAFCTTGLSAEEVVL